MVSILQKMKALLTADMHSLIDRTLEIQSTKTIDEYLHQLNKNLDALTAAKNQTMKNIPILRRKYVEFSAQADRLDHDVDTFILRSKDEFPMADDSMGLHTKVELAQEYYGQWQAQKKQLEDLQALQEYLKRRLLIVEPISRIMQMAFEAGETLDDKTLQLLYTSVDSEKEYIQAWVDGRPKRLDDTGDIRLVELQLEERKRRLLGRNSEGDSK